MNRKSRLYLTFLFLLSLPLKIMAQEQIYSACVVDAENGEPLPLAKVFISANRGVLTNYDGDFSIQALPDDSLAISYIGYRTQRIRVAELPPKVKLEALSHQLHEVTVVPIQPLLVRVSKVLSKEFKQHKNETSTFFMREYSRFYRDSVTHAGLKTELHEAFLRGNSALNLRNPQTLTGYRRGWTPPTTGNVYQMLQLGAMTCDDDYLRINKTLITPLSTKASNKYYNKYYYITYSTITNEDGRLLRRVAFRRYDDIRDPILVGVLLIDEKTLTPLSFDGILENFREHLFVEGEFETLERIHPRIHITYTHERGFTEVSSIFVRNTLSKADKWSTLVNVGELEFEGGVAVTGNNMVLSIDSAGFDREFWIKHETVKRSAQEKALFDDFTPTVDNKRQLDERQRRDSIALSRIKGFLVYDGQSRTAIPFADVEVKGRARTMTNLNGFFQMEVCPDDTLHFHANGYEPLILPAKQLRRINLMTPFKVESRNSKDIDIYNLLAEIGKETQEERAAHANEQSSFFFRRVRILMDDSVMTEAFLNAKSALQIEEPTVEHGYNYYCLHADSITEKQVLAHETDSLVNTEKLLTEADAPEYLSNELLEQFLEVCQTALKLMAEKKGDFKNPFVPLLGSGKTRHYKRHYLINYEILRDNSGRRYCRVHYDKRPNWRYPVITGSLLIDLDRQKLLSFDGDGALKGKGTVHTRTQKDRGGVMIRPGGSVHYDFSHERGFTEVWHAAFYTRARYYGTDYMTEWYTLLNARGCDTVDDDALEDYLLRMYDEEQVTHHPRLPLQQLVPPLITFDIFNEKSNWRLLM